MDIFDVIQKDHDKVRSIFEKIENSKHSGKLRGSNFDRLKEELSVHMKAEENIFYPALQEHAEAKEKVAESLEEHHVAKVLLNEMNKMSREGEHFGAKWNVLKENVLHHMKEEEDNIFAMAEDFWDEDQAIEIGKQFTNDKKQAIAKAG